MESGELALWDPAKIVAHAESVLRHCTFHPLSDMSRSPAESLILRNTMHTGPIRGLDFNPISTTLLASGGIKGEVRLCLGSSIDRAEIRSGVCLGS
jgi:protein transport protein SEC31